MIENMSEYWYLYLILFGLIILTVFVIKKASAASRRVHGRNNELIAKAKREKELRDAYADLTEEIIAAAPADALFEGVALILENQCQKVSDTLTFYNNLTQPQQFIYSVYYLLTDAKEKKLSAFFRNSTQPLTGDAAKAAQAMLDTDTAKTVRQMFDCFDEDNENASVIPEVLDKLDAAFTEQRQEKDRFVQCGEYIKKNSSFFCNSIDSTALK